MKSGFSPLIGGVVSTSAAVLILLLLAVPNAVNAAFNLTEKNNLVLYWGQSAHGSYDPVLKHGQKRLLTYCKDAHVDLISIAFVTVFYGKGGQPEVNFAGSCAGYRMFPGTKLLWCPTIAADIKACQKIGKKVLISIGGSGGGKKSYSGFESKTAAYAFADKIWDAFGRGWTYYRPFGDAVVDGFDLDIELSPTKHFEHFALRLRDRACRDRSKEYFLTAAPQCMLPDAHLTAALTNAWFDAVFVQFYNNPSCAASAWPRIGNDTDVNGGFNFGQWDAWAKSKSCNKDLKVFLALPASAKVAPAGGYVAGTTAGGIIADVAKYTSFAGVALWDASEAWANVGYVHIVKTALDKLSPMKMGHLN